MPVNSEILAQSCTWTRHSLACVPQISFLFRKNGTGCKVLALSRACPVVLQLKTRDPVSRLRDRPAGRQTWYRACPEHRFSCAISKRTFLMPTPGTLFHPRHSPPRRVFDYLQSRLVRNQILKRFTSRSPRPLSHSSLKKPNRVVFARRRVSQFIFHGTTCRRTETA